MLPAAAAKFSEAALNDERAYTLLKDNGYHSMNRQLRQHVPATSVAPVPLGEALPAQRPLQAGDMVLPGVSAVPLAGALTLQQPSVDTGASSPRDAQAQGEGCIGGGY